MVHSRRASLDGRRLTYDDVGATCREAMDWPTAPAGYRRLESTSRVQGRDDAWTEVTEALLRWAVKTRSGFAVDGVRDAPRTAHVGGRHWVSAAFEPVTVSEPIEPGRRPVVHGGWPSPRCSSHSECIGGGTSRRWIWGERAPFDRLREP